MAEVLGWHGSHRWSWPPKIQAPKRDRYEHGCGIYLTNRWERAARYAKGGGSVLRMTLALEPIEEKPIPAAEALEFVRSCPGLRHRDLIRDYINETNRERFFPTYLSNLCVNHEALTARAGPALAEWLTDRGVRYEISRVMAMGAGEEEWLVVFDPSIIQSAVPVRASELDRLAEYGDRDFPLFSTQLTAHVPTGPAKR